MESVVRIPSKGSIKEETDDQNEEQELLSNSSMLEQEPVLSKAFSPKPQSSPKSSTSNIIAESEDATQEVQQSDPGSLVIPEVDEPEATDKNEDEQQASQTSEVSECECETPSGSKHLSSKEKKRESLRSAIAKVKGAALGSVAELKTFRKFLKPRFATPGEAFDEFVGFSEHLDKKTFFHRLEEMQYVGNSQRLFEAISNGTDIIEREVFKQRLVAIGRVQPPIKKKLSFGNVVLHPVQSMKKADLKGMENDGVEDGWDPPPPSVLHVDYVEEMRGPLGVTSPISLLTLSEAAGSPMSSASQEAAVSSQPAASGQPPRRLNEDISEPPATPSSAGSTTPSSASKARAKAKGTAKMRQTPVLEAAPMPKSAARRSGNVASTSGGSRRSSVGSSSKKDNGAGVRSLLSPRSPKESDSTNADHPKDEFASGLPAITEGTGNPQSEYQEDAKED